MSKPTQEPEVIAELRGWHREGCDNLFTIGEVLAVDIGDILASYDELRTTLAAVEAERDALREACSTFVEWLSRESNGSGIPAHERATEKGQALWRTWYDTNLALCQLAQDQARAAIAAASPKTKGTP